MANRAIERRRIADQRLDDQGGERERQRKWERHDSGIGPDRGLRSVHLSRRRARSRPSARAQTRRSPGSTSRPASIRTPIPCPILIPKCGRGCPKAERSRSSKPSPRSVTASTPPAQSQGPARRRSSRRFPIYCRMGRSARSGRPMAVLQQPSPPQALASIEAKRLDELDNARRRNRGQPEQSGWANHAARRPPRSS